MIMPFIRSGVVIKSICYFGDSCEIVFLFLVDGVERELVGKLRGGPGIEGVEYSDELEEFVMLLMKLDQKISKKLCAISWAYACGENVKLPVSLISL
ncbi:hypothetical protein NUH87_30200 [Pseudomonas batumici]|uniref:hypothetical protein n=1 Tax=Pseudomonas batumici TaxID=226910 RepID=UPI0030CE5D82